MRYFFMANVLHQLKMFTITLEMSLKYKDLKSLMSDLSHIWIFTSSLETLHNNSIQHRKIAQT